MGSGVLSSSMALALAGFCCSVLLIAFVCSRLACALLRRRRSRSRRAPPLPHYYPFAAARHPAGPGAGGGGGGGLDPAAVAAFPTRTLAATAGDGPRGSGCSSDADSQ